jgi:hypothetical protein
MSVKELKQYLKRLREAALMVSETESRANRPASMCRRGKAIGSVKRRR